MKDDGKPQGSPSRAAAAAAEDKATTAIAPSPGAIESGAAASGGRDGSPAVVVPSGTHTTRVTREEFRVSFGVMTDPRSIAEYENAIPGAGAKILESFFEQTRIELAHRHKIESEESALGAEFMRKTMRQGDRGQWMAFLIALAGFVVVGWLAHLDKPWLAGVVAVLDIGGLVSVFIYGKKKTVESETMTERQQQQQLVEPRADDQGTPSGSHAISPPRTEE